MCYLRGACRSGDLEESGVDQGGTGSKYKKHEKVGGLIWAGLLISKHRIFYPFFTTKRDGTGLGLPIAKKIVKAHQGSLEVFDNPTKGVTLRVIIPVR